MVKEPVDLLIRTSGEMRISNFLLWQIAYAEFYFTKVHWPSFNKKQLEKSDQILSKEKSSLWRLKMKKRLITGLILSLILIPMISFEIFLGVFQVFMMLFVVIAASEMIRMFEKEKKFEWLPKIGIVLLTLATFFSVAGVFGDLEHSPLEANSLLSITIPLITLILFSFLVLFRNFNGVDVGKALTIINYVGLGSASLVILRFFRCQIYCISTFNHYSY